MSSDTPSTRDLVLQILERMDRVDERMTRVDERMTRVDERMTRVDERMTRVESAVGIGEADTLPLSGRINRLIADLAEFKAEMAEFKAEMIEFKHETLERLEDMERDMARLSRQDAGRWLRLDDRIRVLEHPEEPKG